jgi:hypothetical protein
MSLSSNSIRLVISLYDIFLSLYDASDMQIFCRALKMVETSKALNAKPGRWQETTAVGAGNDDFGPAAREWCGRTLARPERAAVMAPDVSIVPLVKARQLSVRAENVLKELAAELTGATPPKGRWAPSDALLRQLDYRHLLTARNCGPQTTDEILKWAEARGVTIRRPFHAGKPLSAIWRELTVKISAGEFTRAEIAEALERSARRKNTRIPIAFQNVLSKVLSSSGE